MMPRLDAPPRNACFKTHRRVTYYSSVISWPSRYGPPSRSTQQHRRRRDRLHPYENRRQSVLPTTAPRKAVLQHTRQAFAPSPFRRIGDATRKSSWRARRGMSSTHMVHRRVHVSSCRTETATFPRLLHRRRSPLPLPLQCGSPVTTT